MNSSNIEQKIITSTAQITGQNLGKFVREISSETAEFVKRLSNSTTETILEFLENNAQQIKIRDSQDTLYRYNNILLHRTNGPKAYTIEQNLKEAEDVQFAPTFVKYFELGKNDFLTVMEVPSRGVFNIAEVKHLLAPEAKQDFKRGLVSLYKRGSVNREAFANKNSLLVSQDKRHIFITDWSNVTHFAPEERFKYAEAIKNYQI